MRQCSRRRAVVLAVESMGPAARLAARVLLPGRALQLQLDASSAETQAHDKGPSVLRTPWHYHFRSPPISPCKSCCKPLQVWETCVDRLRSEEQLLG
mmetsp:Transcript_2428/g.2990  ORF Transcript_2428/g.2990 Transcript_2428/m.2990 type:complete len:97 (-) Transcript_2428:26-316(-)